MINRFLTPLFFCAFAIGCSETNLEQTAEMDKHKHQESLDFQGHRGSRGLLPENTISGFEKALDLGVKTLEMDAVITKDKKVLVSHEPWFSHEIALDPNGNTISDANEKNHLIYEMDYEETKAYDVGTKPHPRFEGQQKIKATKPLLQEVLSFAEAHSEKTSRPAPYYNIETKSQPEGDGLFHPAPEEFVDLLMTVISDAKIEERTILQSFDIRTLRVARRKYPEIALALLIENSQSPEQNLKKLGFTPDIYSPDYTLVDKSLIAYAKKKGMKVIPWTVNEREEMDALIRMGVDGLITDYPDRLPFQK